MVKENTKSELLNNEIIEVFEEAAERLQHEADLIKDKLIKYESVGEALDFFQSYVVEEYIEDLSVRVLNINDGGEHEE